MPCSTVYPSPRAERGGLWKDDVLKLVIGNKNYSSWSLRAWLLLRHVEIEFREEKISLFIDGFGPKIRRFSPAARVPVLVDDGFAVWDSLAIAEYVAERFPDRGVWPLETGARARARSVCAEMHSGFDALREHMPMNIEAHLPGRGNGPAVQKNLDRIVAIWNELLEAHSSSGPFPRPGR